MPTELAGFDPAQIDDWDEANLKQTEPADFLAVKPGDVITQINGQDVAVDEFWKLNQALAQSDGKPVDLTVAADGGKGAVSHEMVWPHMQDSFVKDDLDFLGMIPRAVIAAIPEKKSPAVGKLFPGDVIEDLESAGDGLADPTRSQVRETLAQAGDKQLAVSLTVLGEDGKERTAENITPNVNLGGGKVGLGIGLQNDEQHLVVADVMKGSSADGKIPVRATITAANDKPITNWFELRTIIAGCAAGDSLKVTYLAHGDETPKVAEIPLTAADIQSARTIAFASDLMLREMPGQKKTTNPVTALKLGVVETRDLIAQFYLTLRRMFTGELSYKNAMGPVGMFTTGKQIATKGANWLLWYLAMISANLAVVNFLPIPIVDGGLFTLLILEKIQGKPLSPEIQRIVQAVGLALILGVFLLVTWQDIARAAGYVN
jgi:regulator of sigma E protease